MERLPRLLLVEDEALIVMSLQMELADAGYEVCRAVATGEEAIRSVRTDYPDIVLMDIGLAGDLDGIETARRIRESHDVSIIFMTGYLEEALMERAREVQPLGYLVKPVNMADLRAVVGSAFGAPSL